MSQCRNIACKKKKAEWKIITNMKKITTNQQVTTKADKGKTLIILTQE
jgi:hypothetical protein